MPTYNFVDTSTKEEFSLPMKMSERENFLIKNPHLQQILTSPVALHSGRGFQKPDEGFRDVLREMKKEKSKGFYRSTINTFD